MMEKFIKDALDNQAGMKALITNASWQDIEGECLNCGKCNLQKAHTNPMRALGGLVTCTNCNRTESFTSHIAKSMFPIQKMIGGALTSYIKDPEE
jgi:hypothetical protein